MSCQLTFDMIVVHQTFAWYVAQRENDTLDLLTGRPVFIILLGSELHRPVVVRNQIDEAPVTQSGAPGVLPTTVVTRFNALSHDLLQPIVGGDVIHESIDRAGIFEKFYEAHVVI